MMQVAAATSLFARCFRRPSAGASGSKLEESDPQAVALGYKHDTTKVDVKKFPRHEPTQKCSNYQLYQGKANEAMGPCTLFPGKQVASAGWCSAWVKKAS
jgi:High potential iron-sulfur protein